MSHEARIRVGVILLVFAVLGVAGFRRYRASHPQVEPPVVEIPVSPEPPKVDIQWVPSGNFSVRKPNGFQVIIEFGFCSDGTLHWRERP